MKYGLPYHGSKSAIAKWVMEYLPEADTFVDLFAGGGAITHAAILSGKYKHFIMNDISDCPRVFVDAINGKYKDMTLCPTREEFKELKETDTAISLLFSFGYNRMDYLYSAKDEPVKVAAHKMIAAPTVYERQKAYREFIKVLAPWLKDLQSVERLQSVESLQRLQRLQSDIKVVQGDYQKLEIPRGATVYADPPYRETACKKYSGFDFKLFDKWLSEIPFPVIISEYTCPNGCVKIAEKEKICHMDTKTCKPTVEGLFIQERFYEEYIKTIKSRQLSLF